MTGNKKEENRKCDRIGRFISPDPVGPVDERTGKVNEQMLLNPQMLNRYAYGLNNPYKYYDPDGRAVVLLAPLAIPALEALGYSILGLTTFKALEQAYRNYKEGMFNEGSEVKADDKPKSKAEGRSTSEKIKDIQENPDKWEKVAESNEPPRGKKTESKRELWKNKDTGETIEKHELKRGNKSADKHPHYKEPKGW